MAPEARSAASLACLSRRRLRALLAAACLLWVGVWCVFSLLVRHDPAKVRVVNTDWPSAVAKYLHGYREFDRNNTWNGLQGTGRYYSNSSAFVQWERGSTALCEGRFVGYASQFALLRDVTLDRTLSSSKRRGGEQIHAVLNQNEDDEYVQYTPGFFRLSGCASKPKYVFAGNNHLNKWMSSLDVVPSERLRDDEFTVVISTSFTIAVLRYEYANLFHTMTDWYNAFLAMAFFNETAATTHVLLVDAHPAGALDPVWGRLFASAVQLSALPPRTRFRRLAWATMGYSSPMTIHATPAAPPLYEKFRQFFLSAHGLSYQVTPRRTLDCARLSLLFIWRRDYVAHPRNPSGHVTRQIANEAELVRTTRGRFPALARVDGAQVDAFNMSEQLRLVTGADLLVGMHGAGLTHALFLAPRAAALIELRPRYAAPSGDHFLAIAQWRGLVYERWDNADPAGELAGHATVVPPRVLHALLKRAIARLCPSGSAQQSPAQQSPVQRQPPAR